MRSLLGRRTVDNRPQRSLGDSRVRIALNECQHGGVEIKDLEYLRDTGAGNAQAAREFSPGFTALLHGALPLARDAYRIRVNALPRPNWFRRLIPGEAVAPFTVDSLPAAIKVKGNIEFEAVRKITRFGEPTIKALTHIGNTAIPLAAPDDTPTPAIPKPRPRPGTRASWLKGTGTHRR